MIECPDKLRLTVLWFLVALIDGQTDIFRLFYRYGFREGDPRLLPSQSDVEELICCTNKFITHELQNYTDNGALEFFATEISWGLEDWTYNGTEQEAPRNVPVIVNFTAHVRSNDGTAAPSNQVLWEATKYFSYFSYVMDYIWKIPGNNVFKSTRGMWYEPFIQQPVSGHMKESSQCPSGLQSPKETPAPTSQTPVPITSLPTKIPTGLPNPVPVTPSPSRAATTLSPTAADGCLGAGGTIKEADCCLSANDFPNLCMIGPCGCGPGNTHSIKICDCPTGKCFDGTACSPDPRMEPPSLGPAFSFREAPTEAPTRATTVPVTLVPSKGEPATLVPTTGAPITVAPTTDAPVTLAPTTSAPNSLAPTKAPIPSPTEPPRTRAPVTERPTEAPREASTTTPTQKQQPQIGGGPGDIFGSGSQQRPPEPSPAAEQAEESSTTTAPPDPTPLPSAAPSAARVGGGQASQPSPTDDDRTLEPTRREEELVYFNIKLDFFDGLGREPQADEVEAMICQTNSFFKESIKTSTSDPNVVSYATNIDWEYKPSERLPFTVYFTSHTTDGQGKIIPAADMYQYILKDSDAKSLVKDYIWNSEPYPSNIFYNTEDIMLGGSYSGSKKGRPLVPGKLARATCPS